MKKIIVMLLLGTALGGCVEVFNKEGESNTALIDQLVIPDGFDFTTSKGVTLDLFALDNGDRPLKNIPFQFSFPLDTAEISLGTMATSANGKVSFQNSIPDHVDTLYIRTEYPGLPSLTKLAVNAGQNQLTLGGASAVRNNSGGREQVQSNGREQANGFTYKGTYDAQGVPNYLEPVNDYIPQDLLDLVNASLPERSPVPTANPQYISDNIIADTRLADSADVWVTFVTEGAGYLNSLGYYTYDMRNPPASIADISEFKIIFPNVSLPGSGGNLRTGNKVFIGTFPKNTAIGWFLVPNGWNGTQVAQRPEIKYSTKAFNTYTQTQYRQQVVLLQDDIRQLLLLGFEDLSRPSGDNDFNDAVFFVTASPYSAVITDSNVGVAKSPTGTDTDGDGVLDKNDKYPNDATKAFDVYNPGDNIYGSLAFEDQWPAKGDYDLNDLVVDYNFQFVTNTSNSAIECRAKFLVKAIGAAYHNGFGIQLPIASSLVESVTMTNTSVTGIVTNANGTEAGQDKATVIAFTDAQALFNTSGFVNTRESETYVQPVEISMVIRFTTPIRMAELGYAPFNPFLIVNGDRRVEVHLADQVPTDKADVALLGTSADSSVPANGRYYKSGNNLPWAINLATTFDYPKENRPVNETHLKFGSWAQTSGTSFKDWYQNRTGYREGNNVYQRK